MLVAVFSTISFTESLFAAKSGVVTRCGRENYEPLCYLLFMKLDHCILDFLDSMYFFTEA